MPEETNFSSGHTQCRIAWRLLTSGFSSHGDWFDLKYLPGFRKTVHEQNERWRDSTTYWVEFR